MASRDGNAKDIEELQNLFADYEDCTFKQIEPPPLSEGIDEILCENGIISLFEDSIKFI